MFIAQQLMLLVLRNAFEILVLTAVNHSETDWNIRHAFKIWAYIDYFGSPTTPLMSVFGVRSECAETPPPPKKNKKIGNSEKKNWAAAILAGRSEHSKLTKF